MTNCLEHTDDEIEVNETVNGEIKANVTFPSIPFLIPKTIYELS